MNYRLSFNGPIREGPTNALRDRIATIIERQNFESLTILFSSEGGSTDQSLSLYNFLRQLPVPITMHAVGHVGSSAVPVFLGGHVRTCAPLSRFFFHVYDWGFDARQTLDRIAEATQRLESDINIAREIAKRHTKLSDEQLEAFYRSAPKPTILDPTQAKVAGIVESITELGADASGNTAVWTVNWTVG